MSVPILPITSLLISAFFIMLGTGLAGILIPVRGSIEGWSSYEIGLFGTSYALAFTAGCVIVPHFVRRAGHVRTFSSLAALLAIAVLLCGLFVAPVGWMMFRALTGLGLAGCYMITESWLNERVTNETRGTVFSIYMIVTMGGMMGGQYVLPFSSPQTTIAFMLCAIFFAVAVIPTALSRAESPKPLTVVKLDLPMIFRNSPVAAVGVLLAGILSAAWTNMAPVFGQRIGLSTTEIATLTVSAMAGGIVFQVPFGRVSDRVDRRYVMMVVGILGIAAAVAGVYLGTSGDIALFTIAFILGGIIYPAYSLAVAHANDFAANEDFVKISGGLLMLYGIGTMIGPIYAAYLIETLGPEGLFQSLGTTAAVYAIYAYYRTHRRAAIPADERTDFRTAPLARAHTPETYELYAPADDEAPGSGEGESADRTTEASTEEPVDGHAEGPLDKDREPQVTR